MFRFFFKSILKKHGSRSKTIFIYFFFSSFKCSNKLNLFFFWNCYCFFNLIIIRNVLFSNNFLNYYKYFYINNFIHLINFNKFFLLNENVTSFVKKTILNKKTSTKFKNLSKKMLIFKKSSFLFKKNKNKKSIYFLKNVFSIDNNYFRKTYYNLKLKSFISKTSLFFLRSKSTKVVNFFFFLSKLAFSPSLFYSSYFKKTTSSAFQLSPYDTFSPNFIKLTKSSPMLSKYEFNKNIINKENYRLTTTINLIFFKNLNIFNLFNSNDNFFFNNFQKLKKNNSTSFVPLTFKTLFLPILKTLKYQKKLNIYYSSTYQLCSDFTNFTNQYLYAKNSLYTQYFLISPNVESIQNHSTQYFTSNTSKPFYHPLLHSFFYSNSNFLFLLFKKHFLFKFFFFFNGNNLQKNFTMFYTHLNNNFKSFYFYSKLDLVHRSNLVPTSNFFFILKKKILKIFSYDKFPSNALPFYINSLMRFFEHCSGKQIIFKVYTLLNNSLTYYEKATCVGWAQKVKVFRRMLGPRLFLAESLEIIYLSFKLKDPFFLTNWLVNMMKKISFWKYRLFFRYLKYVLRYFFVPIFKDLKVRGIKFRLKGKISVAGNARTRTILQRTGRSSHATFDNKVLQDFSIVRSFTGVMGLKVWIFF